MTAQTPKAYKGMAMEGVIARWYAKTRENDVEDRDSVVRTIRATVPKGSQILEVAPGPGYLSIELAKTGDYIVTGLDISKTFVEIARGKARAAGVTVDFQQGNASAMPFQNERFDFIVCRAAFKNFSDPVGAMDEMYRVLKAGGQAVIIDLNPDTSAEEIDAYLKSTHLSPINAMMTKWAFESFLKKNAHSKQTLTQFAAQSRFGRCEIREVPMTYEVWLRK